MAVPHKETENETQVLSVFRKTDENGEFVYDDEAVKAASVFCAIALVREGRLTMATLPNAVRTLCDQYFREQNIKVEAPVKMIGALNASFARTIPVALMRDLNEAMSSMARTGGLQLAEALAKRAAKGAKMIDGKMANPSRSAMAAPKSIGVGNRTRR